MARVGKYEQHYYIVFQLNVQNVVYPLMKINHLRLSCYVMKLWRIHRPTTKAPMVSPVIKLRLRICFEFLFQYSSSCCLLSSCFWAGVRCFGPAEDEFCVFSSMFVPSSVTSDAAPIKSTNQIIHAKRQVSRCEQPRGVALTTKNILFWLWVFQPGVVR